MARRRGRRATMRLRNWITGAVLAPLLAAATSFGSPAVRVAAATAVCHRPADGVPGRRGRGLPRLGMELGLRPRPRTGPGHRCDGTPTAFGIGLRDHLRARPWRDIFLEWAGELGGSPAPFIT